MAAGEYLKAAASNLNQAATYLRRQAKDLQASLVSLRTEKHHLINKDTLHVKTTQMEQVSVHDNRLRQELAREISVLQREIVQAERELKQKEKEINAAASAKLSAAMDIESQAKELESQAARLD